MICAKSENREVICETKVSKIHRTFAVENKYLSDKKQWKN